jgi:phosphate transport system substrate-binding protein
MMMNNLKRNYVLIISAVFAFMFLTGCSGNGNKVKETATSGNIKIAVDEAYQLLFDTEIYTFESFYKYAKINPLYKPEGEAIDLFMKDSVRFVVSSRKLTDAEDKLLRSQKYIPKTEKICYDALAFIINKENLDSQLLYNSVKDIFTGKITKWSDIDPKSALGDLIVVFDNNKSSNTRLIREEFGLTNNFPSNCFAVKSNTEVLSYVEKNKNSIGIISVNWISDKNDSVSHRFLKNIRVVALGSIANTDGTGDFYKPYVGNIADGSYPLTREVYIINRETFTGLGTGFVSFIAHDKGQRIILKSGLVPATMPLRYVELKTK